jgi:hypothetical protein
MVIRTFKHNNNLRLSLSYECFLKTCDEGIEQGSDGLDPDSSNGNKSPTRVTSYIVDLEPNTFVFRSAKRGKEQVQSWHPQYEFYMILDNHMLNK